MDFFSILRISDQLKDIVPNANKDLKPLLSISSLGVLFIKSTTSKRLRTLEAKGLVYIKKQGRSKTVHVSDKGKALLHKRQAF